MSLHSLTKIQNGPSHFGGMTIAFHQALSSYNVDADAVFEKVGIRFSNLNTPESRITSAQYGALMQACMEASGDPLFVFKTAEFVQPSCFNALGFALFSSRTIGKFLHRLNNSYSFLSTADSIELAETDEGAKFVVHQAQSVRAPEIEAAFSLGTLIWISRMAKLMYGPTFRQTEVRVPLAANWMADDFQPVAEAFFNCPVAFGGSVFALFFDRETLDQPLPSANAELARQNDEVLLGIMSRMERANVPMRVQHKLLELLPTGEYSKAKVAKELGFSVRDLHNKLALAETSFQQLLDDTRLSVATQYLRQERYSVGDVAFLLGYSDFSNFSRAFKKWTGKTPSEYRIEMLGE